MVPSLPGEHQVFDVPESGRVLQLLMAGLDPVLGYPPVPLAQRDPQFPTGEVGAETAVHATAERDVRVVLAVETYRHGVAERVGIHVRGAVVRYDGSAGLDVRAAREVDRALGE